MINSLINYMPSWSRGHRRVDESEGLPPGGLFSERVNNSMRIRALRSVASSSERIAALGFVCHPLVIYSYQTAASRRSYV